MRGVGRRGIHFLFGRLMVGIDFDAECQDRNILGAIPQSEMSISGLGRAPLHVAHVNYGFRPR